MANDTNTSFPTIPAKHWWGIREKFKRSIPSQITVSYLEASLGVNKRSAETLISPLKIMGIIEGDGKPKDRAVRWRDDDTYAEVCGEIKQEVYPEELLHAVPDPTTNREAAERWFARQTKAGTVVTQKMAALYQLLSEADPSKNPETSKTSESKPKKKPHRSVNTKSNNVQNDKAATPNIDTTGAIHNSSSNLAPSIHIDIQIHISAEASAAQIDQIFSSMSKHLYRQNNI